MNVRFWHKADIQKISCSSIFCLKDLSLVFSCHSSVFTASKGATNFTYT